MPAGMKECPNCGTLQHAARRTCANGLCAHEWPKRKSRAVENEPEESTEPEFCAGVTTDGRVMLVWPRRQESVTLDPKEADVLCRALRGFAP